VLKTHLRKLKIELPYNPAIALLGIYTKDTNIVTRRGTCIPVFIAGMLKESPLEKSRGLG